jgi:hypothetical protein
VRSWCRRPTQQQMCAGRPGASKPGSKLRSHTNWPQAGGVAGRILMARYTLTQAKKEGRGASL